eukprot:TRINITY_DN1247_c0_g3_i2.p2 TRINITY_DN1247_c0_g3~~TRINITY_DN1247_c0_g3_i2.p2  ORF type:complete len:303 (+),score=44.73 TRINITY_DN1247_c0_g3_i2:131-910(+)
MDKAGKVLNFAELMTLCRERASELDGEYAMQQQQLDLQNEQVDWIREQMDLQRGQMEVLNQQLQAVQQVQRSQKGQERLMQRQRVASVNPRMEMQNRRVAVVNQQMETLRQQMQQGRQQAETLLKGLLEMDKEKQLCQDMYKLCEDYLRKKVEDSSLVSTSASEEPMEQEAPPLHVGALALFNAPSQSNQLRHQMGPGGSQSPAPSASLSQSLCSNSFSRQQAHFLSHSPLNVERTGGRPGFVGPQHVTSSNSIPLPHL